MYVAATDGNLYALNRDTGEEQWRFDGGQRLSQPPTVVGSDDQSVVIGSDAGNVFSTDAASGEMYWSHQLEDRVNTPPVVVDSVIYIGDNSGRLYALANENSNVGAEGGSCRIPASEETDRSQGDTDNDDVAKIMLHEVVPFRAKVTSKRGTAGVRPKTRTRSSWSEPESVPASR